MDSQEKKEMYIVKRANSLKYALRGIAVFVRITPNFWVHFVTFLVLIIFGFFFHLTINEWLVLILANALVIAAEAVNTAIEIDMNLTHPGRHSMVRDTKDIAAGAVLIAGVAAWIIDLLIFLSHVHLSDFFFWK